MIIKPLNEETLVWWVKKYHIMVFNTISEFVDTFTCDKIEIFKAIMETIGNRLMHDIDPEKFAHMSIEEFMKNDAVMFDVLVYSSLCCRRERIVPMSEYAFVLSIMLGIEPSESMYGKMVPVARLINEFGIPLKMVPKSILNMCYQGNEFIKANMILSSIMGNIVTDCRKHMEDSKDYEELMSLMDASVNTITKTLNESECYDYKSVDGIKTVLLCHTIGIMNTNLPSIYNFPRSAGGTDMDEAKLKILGMASKAFYHMIKELPDDSGGIDGN
jgi:hypothetical protein